VKPSRLDEAAGVVFPIGLLGMACMPAIWGYQIFYWLRWGEWLPISIGDSIRWAGISQPRFAWRGVQQVSDLVMTAPLSVTIFAVSLGVMVAFVEVADRYEKRKATDEAQAARVP
jgi:hypothetical protein